MSQVEQAIDWLNELDPWAQWGVGIVSTFMALGIVRLFMKKVVLDFVKNLSVIS